jgi:hypothetical protein
MPSFTGIYKLGKYQFSKEKSPRSFLLFSLFLSATEGGAVRAEISVVETFRT